MSIPVIVPGDRGGEATQDVARLLAGITLPPIESFGPDNAALAGLPAFIPAPAPDPEPPSRLSVARGVYDSAIQALAVLKRLEDATAACKAALVARLLGAAHVEATTVVLDRWQSGVAITSACADIALTLCIPERTAAALAHHSTELVNHPGTMAALATGELSFRHAGIIIDEGQTLAETPGILPTDLAAFEARLLALAPGTTVSGFAAKARRARESTHPETLTTRTKQAYAQRAMTLEPGRDGMSWLTLHLPAVAAEGIWVDCTRTARAIKGQARSEEHATGQDAAAGMGSGEYRTLTQLRIDVAAALLLNQHPLGNKSSTNKAGDTSFSTSTAPTGTTATDHRSATGTGGVARSNHDSGTGRTSAGGVGDVPFGGKSAFGVTLFDQEPVWAHRDPKQPVGRYTNPDPTPAMRGSSNGAGRIPALEAIPSAGLASGIVPEPAPGAESLLGVVCDGGSLSFTPEKSAPENFSGDSVMEGDVAADEAIFGELLGDGSGYVGGVVDGLREDPDREYREQLDAIRAHKVITDPPMPEATILLTVPFLGALDITDEPAELVGSSASAGPVPEGIARKLLAGAGTFLRVLTDPVSGEPLGLNPERYRMRESEKAVLRALAQGCYYPNCTNPVMDTDTDHLTAWERGGATTPENMRPACKRHHLLKHFKDDKDMHGNYRTDQDPDRHQIRLRGWTPLPQQDGRIGWISPSGRYHRPQHREPRRPAYPKSLKKRLEKALNHDGPDFAAVAPSPLEQLILKYQQKHPS
ncbi:HNH endonuclease signature motif containing protein [Arthrobacter sp. TMN-49]